MTAYAKFGQRSLYKVIGKQPNFPWNGLTLQGDEAGKQLIIILFVLKMFTFMNPMLQKMKQKEIIYINRPFWGYKKEKNDRLHTRCVL